MNSIVIVRLLSILILVLSGFMFFPLAISIYYKEHVALAFLLPITIGIFVGSTVLALTKSDKKEISKKDSFILVVSSWILASVFGCIPFILGAHLNFTNAFFETMSGFTTTGASILTNIEILPKSILFWRSLTHWLGGMGIIVLAVAILPILGIGGVQLIKAEAPGPTMEKLSPRITSTAKYLWLAYVVLSLIETILLLFGGMNLFDALTHMFGTMATGGFSTKNTSIAYFHSAYIDWVITIFMFLAGMNFALHFKLMMGKFSVFKDEELRFYIFIISAAVLIVTIKLLHYYGDFFTSLRYAAFQVVSISTTTGYATADYEKWPYLAQAILFLMMFVGGCSGSTSGSIKIIRIYTLLKQAINEMKYYIHPKGIFLLKFNGKLVKKDTVYAISGFFFLYIATFFVIALLVSAFGVNLLTAFSASAATLGNIGPGFGMIGPAENYSHLPLIVKWILSFAMLAGRLEIYTVFVIFTPIFWKK